MSPRALLTLCLIFLTLNGTQGIPLLRISRCSCVATIDRLVNPRLIEKLEMIPPSPSCSRAEIIVTVKKTGEKRCLNPDSKVVRNFLKTITMKKSKGPL
ncbi:PREDICTED: C-X-C motif chemokine 10 [Condylura cristata]|uniref:C-X-C motif chemokine 10 n=1 Tax=Condylura cristata TaxID=143302 RepID=UPI000643DFF8|nr:PREDICTED: C-X-C motif chemokine 10 [Condylura cristata]